jgi:hypothetical protein
MARDLIPPPSPSGRPLPEGSPREGVPRLIELPPEPAEPRAKEAKEPPASLPPSRFRNRFGFLAGALGGVVLAAVALLVIVLLTQNSRPNEGLAKNWSRWHPTDTSINGGPEQIAAYVGAQYHLEDGKQLVSVTGGPLEVQGIKLGIALRPAQGQIKLLNGHAVLYTLNGLGPSGSIKGGKPSTQRHQLLRREALELALYSFRYLPDVDEVVTLLPPAPPADANGSSSSSSASSADGNTQLQAVFYEPGDLKPELQVPLGNTVPSKAPEPETIPPVEARRIDTLTLSNLFLASFQQAQDLKPYLVLDRPS